MSNMKIDTVTKSGVGANSETVQRFGRFLSGMV
ncbi:MAG: hypothetical protein K0S75_3031, partial [Clostridia bacterium]|nr:hypothetical protein [Clostridia bacterium]